MLGFGPYDTAKASCDKYAGFRNLGTVGGGIAAGTDTTWWIACGCGIGTFRNVGTVGGGIGAAGVDTTWWIT